MVLISEMKYGLKAQSINDIANRLSNIDWYKEVGVKEQKVEEALQRFLTKLQVTNYDIEWISKEQTAQTISHLNLNNSELWDVLSNLPDQLKKKIDDTGQIDLLREMIEIVPHEVFHVAFQKAFQQFGEEKQVQFFVTQAMYIAVLVCTAELAGEDELFKPLLELLEAGHVPVGIDENTIYLL